MTLAVLLAAPLAGQEKTEPPKPRQDLKAARLDIVLSRFQGERKLSSTPYSIGVVIGGKTNTLRVGTEVPISVVQYNKDAGMPVTSYQYKNVGLDLQCVIRPNEGGGFLLDPLEVQESSLFEDGTLRSTGKPLEAPMFRSRQMRGSLVVRDGEKTVFYFGADPATGDTIKGEVTLTVTK